MNIIKDSKHLITLSVLFALIIFTFSGTVNAKSNLTVTLPKDDQIIYLRNNATNQLKPVVTLDGKKITDATLTYKSSNTNVASVSKDGLISSKKDGSAKITITAKYQNQTAKISNKVYVRSYNKGIKSFNNAPRISVSGNTEKEDNLVLTFEDGSGLTTDNIKFFTVNSNGKKDKEITDSNFLVKDYPKAVSTNKKNAVTKYQYAISTDYQKQHINNNKLKLYISAKDASGNYFNTYISLSFNGTVFKNADVAPRLSHWGANKNKVSFVVSDYATAEYIKIYDMNSKNKASVVFEKNDFNKIRELVTFDTSEFTKNSNGYYKIRIEIKDKGSNGINAVSIIKFSLEGSEKLSLSLAKNNTTLSVGKSEKIDTTVSLGNTSVKNANISYSSSNPEIATVDKNGTLTAVKKGSSTIALTAQYNNQVVSSKVSVTVNEELAYSNNKKGSSSTDTNFATVEYPKATNIDNVDNLLNSYNFKADNDSSHNKGRSSTEVHISPYFTATINNVNIPVYASPVQIANQQNVMALHSYSTIRTNSKKFEYYISIKSNIKVKSVNIYTSTKKLRADIDNNIISFKLDSIEQYTVLINGDDQKYAYTIFVEKRVNEVTEIENYKNKGYNIVKYTSGMTYVPENTLVYFTKGIHSIDTIELASNSVLYLKSGAIVLPKHKYEINSYADRQRYNVEENKTRMGTTQTRNPVIYSTGSNVKILGSGLIDFSRLDHAERSGITFAWGSNIEISRVTLINPAMWTITTYRTNKVDINKVKIIGYRSNSDAFALTNTTNSTVKSCFARSGDDLFEVKTLGGSDDAVSSNITYSNCVAWGSCRAFGIVGETEKDISNITFKNSTVIYSEGTWDYNRIGSLVIIKESGSGRVSDVKFSNIRIYHELGRAININIFNNVYNSSISNVTFSNIKYNSKVKNHSGISTTGNGSNSISNINFTKVLTNSNTVVTPNDTNYNE